MLYYDAALRKERRDRRVHIVDTNAATIGGKQATDLVAKLKD